MIYLESMCIKQIYLSFPKLYLPIGNIKANMRRDNSINLAVRGRGTGLRFEGGIYHHQRRSKHLARPHWQQVQLSTRTHTHAHHASGLCEEHGGLDGVGGDPN